MRARSGWLASSVALGLVLAACPGAAGPGPSGSPTATTIAPRGTARVAVPEEPATLNPLTLPGLATATRDLLPLVTPVVTDGEIRPGGVRARITRSATQARIEVLPGAQWSDGAAISASDIVTTWRTVRAARLPFEGYRSVTAARIEVGAAVLDLPGPFDEAFPGGMRLLPPGFTASAYARRWPVSGGPFRFERWTPGLKMRFTANATAPGGAPSLAAIEVTFVPDPDAELELFRRGEIDVLPRFGTPAWHDRLMRQGGARTVEGAETRIVGLAIRTRGTLATADRRRRLLARIDLARINDVLVQDEALLRCDREPRVPLCASNPPRAKAGAKASDALVLAYESSDVLAARIAIALRRMLGPVRLQGRTARDLWTHLGEIDLILVTTRESGGGAPAVLSTVAGAGNARSADGRVLVMFRARAGLSTRSAVTLRAPGPAGPFDGAGSWPAATAAR